MTKVNLQQLGGPDGDYLEDSYLLQGSATGLKGARMLGDEHRNAQAGRGKRTKRDSGDTGNLLEQLSPDQTRLFRTLVDFARPQGGVVDREMVRMFSLTRTCVNEGVASPVVLKRISKMRGDKLDEVLKLI